MMFEALLADDAVRIGVDAHSKKHAIQEIGTVAARLTDLPERLVFDTLLERERLGSTGIGHGIAIPHGKFHDLGGLKAVFFRLQTPIDFEALDDEPVDLLFALLAPDESSSDHLKALAKIARLLREPGMTDALREATSRSEVHSLLTRSPVPAG